MTDVRPHVLRVLQECLDGPEASVFTDRIIAEIAKGKLKYPATQWAVRYNTKAAEDMQLGTYDEYQVALAMQLQLHEEGHPEAYLVTHLISPWEPI